MRVVGATKQHIRQVFDDITPRSVFEIEGSGETVQSAIALFMDRIDAGAETWAVTDGWDAFMVGFPDHADDRVSISTVAANTWIKRRRPITVALARKMREVQEAYPTKALACVVRSPDQAVIDWYQALGFAPHFSNCAEHLIFDRPALEEAL